MMYDKDYESFWMYHLCINDLFFVQKPHIAHSGFDQLDRFIVFTCVYLGDTPISASTCLLFLLVFILEIFRFLFDSVYGFYLCLSWRCTHFCLNRFILFISIYLVGAPNFV